MCAQATQAVAEIQISDSHAVPEQVSEEYNSSSEKHIPPAEALLPPMQSFPVSVAAVIPVVPGVAAAVIPTPIPVVAQQPIPAMQPAAAPVETSYYTNTTFMKFPQDQQQQQQQQQVQQQSQQQQQQQPAQQTQAPATAPAPKINDVIGPSGNFFFLQESELDTPLTEVVVSVPSQAPLPPPTVVSHINSPVTVVPVAPVSLNAPIPTQTFTNQSFAGTHVVPAQVIFLCTCQLVMKLLCGRGS